MSEQKIEPITLQSIADKIAHCATEAEEKVLEAAELIREARKRVDAGEAGEITWYEWARDNIKLSPSRLRELYRIAEAEDPTAELKRIRRQNDMRQARHREKKKSASLRNDGATVAAATELEEDRQSLIEWAQSAPLDRVAKALSYIRQLDSEAADSESNQPTEPAVV